MYCLVKFAWLELHNYSCIVMIGQLQLHSNSKVRLTPLCTAVWREMRCQDQQQSYYHRVEGCVQNILTILGFLPARAARHILKYQPPEGFKRITFVFISPVSLSHAGGHKSNLGYFLLYLHFLHFLQFRNSFVKNVFTLDIKNSIHVNS